MAKKETIVEIAGKQLKLSNLDKVLYPAVGFTKGQVIDYFVRIAPVLLPHLKDRPLTMKRYPEGVDGMFFYEKNCPKHRPDWVQTAKVWSHGRSDYMQYCMAQDLPTLVWAANLADLELHTSLSRAEKIEQPTMMVFDLDPGPPANIVLCCQVGFWLKEIFDRFKLQAFPKTSGSKGLQIYVPLNTPVTYDQTKGFSRALARLLEEQHPDLVVADMKKALRVGKVFVDWSQNDEHKTTINVYSLRAKERPTVSTPVSWDEVEQCLKKKDAKLLVFDAQQVLSRVEKTGDLFALVQTLKQRLPDVGELSEEAAPKSGGRAQSSSKEPKPRATRKKAARTSIQKARVKRAG
jgi:bifunctional non-homologous end joining protein LigD